MYKNPQCNWECCLSVILSAQDAGKNDEEMSGDIGDNDMEREQAQGDDFAVRAFGFLLHLIFSLASQTGVTP